MKTLIKNAMIATSQMVTVGDVYIEDEKIKKVGPQLEVGDVDKVIDATGKYLLPGGIDPHTHFDLDAGIARASDDWYTGSVAAACGGTTTVVDHMAFGPQGCRLTHQLGVYHKLSEKAVIDYGFHGVVQYVNDDILEDMETLIKEEGVNSFKVYLTYNDRLSDHEILRVLQKAKELGAVVCAHCENHATIELFRQELVEAGKVEPRFHPISRPASCEAEAVWRMAELAHLAGDANVYVVHLSTDLGLSAIRLARSKGQQNLYAETCPQYLFLDDSRYDDPEEGLKYIMSPPLRKREDELSLWNGLADGAIQTIGTDHCPFFLETQKKGYENFTQVPNGAPGVETRMQLLFSYGFMQGRLSLPQVVQTCCTNPAKIFGIYPQKGDILPGSDADLVLFDPKEIGHIQHAELHENVDYTPYEGITYQGAPVMTMSRGTVIVENHEFIGETGRGRYLKRQALGTL